MANTSTNVTTGKPKAAGAIYRAPLGSTLPTDATTALASAYVALGYVSSDGVKNNNSPSTSDIKAWGGDTVLTTQTEKPDSFTMKLIEALNVEVLKAVYNSGNVTGSLSSGITVRANSSEAEAAIWVIEMFMTGNVYKRIVIPNAKISSISEITYKDDEAVGYEITLSAMPGDATFGNDTHKEYIIQSSTNT